MLQGSDEWRELLIKRLSIDTFNGKCFWKDASKNHPNLIGKEAGCLRKGVKDYWVIKINGKAINRSKIIFSIANGYWPIDQIYHLNKNSLDDRSENLVEVKHHKTRARSAIKIGEKYGMLTVISEHGKAKDKHLTWFCLCECGNEIVISSNILKRRKSVSCGCLTTSLRSESAKKHGHHGTKEYRAWIAIKGRCNSKDNKDFSYYGAKGINVHKEWFDDFQLFYDHVGKCPGEEFSIDRIDNTKGYEPGNVRWATRSDQQKNKSTSYFWFIDGIKFDSMTEAANYFSVSTQTIYKWVYGYFDKRRNKFTQPKTNCFNERKYV